MRKLTILTAFFSILLIACSACAPSRAIQAPLYQQQTHYTCWAASLRSVIKYYKNFDMDECAIVSEINKRYGIPLDCCHPETFMDTLKKAQEAQEEDCGCNKMPVEAKMQCDLGCSLGLTSEASLEANTDVSAPVSTDTSPKADAQSDNPPAAPAEPQASSVSENAEPQPDAGQSAQELFIQQMLLSRFCHRGGSLTDLMVALEVVFKISYRYYSHELTFEQVVKEIDQGHVILVARLYPLGGGHMHPIVGYNKKTHSVIVNEVTLGLPMEEPYEEYRASLKRGIWNATLVITDRPAERPTCNWVFGDLFCVNNPAPESAINELSGMHESFIKKAIETIQEQFKVVKEALKKHLGN